jgi:superfamily II DNA/RNA helicase
VRLDGSVPQNKRQELVHEFQTNPECRFFITTNAGSTGLNLQAANMVINVDLPWNPAVLEQRIGRAHRMGQTQPVQVFVLITEGTLEENLLGTLSAKRELALAALDAESSVESVDLASGSEELKSRLEVLLGAKPAAPVDKTEEREQQTTVARDQQRRERVAAAGGEMLGAVFQFLGELVGGGDNAAPPAEPVVREVSARLKECVEVDETGKARLTVTFPNQQALEGLAQTLVRMMAGKEAS